MRWRMYPVNHEATTPERFAKAHCNPVQRPDAWGPARVCVVAHMLEALRLSNTPVSISSAMHPALPTRVLANKQVPPPAAPTIRNVFRTRVEVAPAASQRSA